ncbi:hypothetical protein HFM64_001722 [Campylobacter jejuni]|nr:hypothetical protein [Campylobacter jejuni]
MAIKIEISGFDKDFLPVFESLAKSLSKKPILSMFSLSNSVFNPFRFNYRKNSCGFVNIIMRI